MNSLACHRILCLSSYLICAQWFLMILNLLMILLCYIHLQWAAQHEVPSRHTPSNTTVSQPPALRRLTHNTLSHTLILLPKCGLFNPYMKRFAHVSESLHQITTHWSDRTDWPLFICINDSVHAHHFQWNHLYSMGNSYPQETHARKKFVSYFKTNLNCCMNYGSAELFLKHLFELRSQLPNDGN